MTTFVDTNVIIYLQDPQSAFHAWAKDVIGDRRVAGPLIISDIVYSELSVAFDSVAATDEVVSILAFERLRFSNQVLFRAGKAYAEHRQRGGSRSNVLSDFLIGAQAVVEQAPLVTNNGGEFTSFFPGILLIVPPV